MTYLATLEGFTLGRGRGLRPIKFRPFLLKKNQLNLIYTQILKKKKNPYFPFVPKSISFSGHLSTGQMINKLFKNNKINEISYLMKKIHSSKKRRPLFHKKREYPKIKKQQNMFNKLSNEKKLIVIDNMKKNLASLPASEKSKYKRYHKAYEYGMIITNQSMKTFTTKKTTMSKIGNAIGKGIRSVSKAVTSVGNTVFKVTGNMIDAAKDSVKEITKNPVIQGAAVAVATAYGGPAAGLAVQAGVDLIQGKNPIKALKAYAMDQIPVAPEIKNNLSKVAALGMAKVLENPDDIKSILSSIPDPTDKEAVLSVAKGLKVTENNLIKTEIREQKTMFEIKKDAVINVLEEKKSMLEKKLIEIEEIKKDRPEVYKSMAIQYYDEGILANF